jgi:gluconokinase
MADTEDEQPCPSAAQPDVVIVMGVSGSGKSTVAQGISTVLGWEFAEGDAFHSEANVAKMCSGQPLTDEDRWPWLRAIADWTRDRVAEGRATGVTCSALRRPYRDLLREGAADTCFVHMAGPPELILERMKNRKHFMPPSMLDSQLATLEPFDDDERFVEVDIRAPLDQIVDDLVSRFETENR